MLSLTLTQIPLTLAKNSGFDSINYVERVREIQINTNDSTIGIDCLETGEKNMKKSGIFESLSSKVSQLRMATDLVNMILKINVVISIAE